jgi:SpoVK/Ycf46/Vps4 family AAA+-type ATPase
VIACTNCPWDIDGAILRRFPKRVFVPLPDEAAREALLKALLKRAGKHCLTSHEISQMAKRLAGFSGSDMRAIASEASFEPLRSVGGLDAIRQVKAKDVRPIAMDDFQKALQHATRSVTKDSLNRYNDWNQQQAA